MELSDQFRRDFVKSCYVDHNLTISTLLFVGGSKEKFLNLNKLLCDHISKDELENAYIRFLEEDLITTNIIIEQYREIINSNFMNRSKYAWCFVPLQIFGILRRIQEIENLQIVEICAGKGFYANLMQKIGMQIIATDNNKELKSSETTYNNFKVEQLDYNDAIHKYSDIYKENYILFVTWCRENLTDASFINAIKPKYICFQGEKRGGCTGCFLVSGYKKLYKLKISNYAPWIFGKDSYILGESEEITIYIKTTDKEVMDKSKFNYYEDEYDEDEYE